MKLIASKTSPFARKVRIVLAEKNLPFDFIVDVPWDADTEVPKFNPLGKVPVLVRDGGDTLYDSRVIVEYLEQVKPWPMLIPVESGAMIEVKKWDRAAAPQDRQWPGGNEHVSGGAVLHGRAALAGRHCRGQCPGLSGFPLCRDRLAPRLSGAESVV